MKVSDMNLKKMVNHDPLLFRISLTWYFALRSNIFDLAKIETMREMQAKLQIY